MASNKKKVLPTAKQVDDIIQFLTDGCYSDPTEEYEEQYNEAVNAVINYLESLHPVVYKIKRVKAPSGRLGLK
jgi:ribosomal protein S8